MARTVRNAKLDTRSGRAKLAPRREPYWTVISAGCAVGYRRGAQGGTWVARMREGIKQHYEALGAADDSRDADGLTVFSFAQAQERARVYFTRKARELAGLDQEAIGVPWTVSMALADYLAARERRGSKGVRADRYAAEARILPVLGAFELAALTTKRIRDWHHDLAEAPKLRRTGAGAIARKLSAVDATDPEAVRARRATANRVLTILKAALNHAFQEGKTSSDEAWRRVKPYREADAAKIRYLPPDECRRLLDVCEGPFRDLVRGALATGCRYGELGRIRVSDFDAQARTVMIAKSKQAKPRHIALSDEGAAFFAALTSGRPRTALVFSRTDGEPWGASHQQRPLIEASARAGLEPPCTFHILRHTYASALAMRGVPMRVIADQLGHADTRVTEKHYAHLTPSYVAEAVRQALPALGYGLNR
ncbi:tyrosine-type recombinase/integrase [Methylobacterium longum]|uniref:Site-specific integrase n=1 Tax=Methylobacterium longum TaxID=767694 RepID=A0ABT8AUM0_9HYPH|nr:site-specific integrase [Methylobacterium longum]MDN3573110.1 site-specific integrase [Methylobacterium longum]GJE12076.1 Tyrosine recombinase XerC [Methylobacterium longum]